jgi:hypothetical protein
MRSNFNFKVLDPILGLYTGYSMLAWGILSLLGLYVGRGATQELYTARLLPATVGFMIGGSAGVLLTLTRQWVLLTPLRSDVAVTLICWAFGGALYMDAWLNLWYSWAFDRHSTAYMSAYFYSAIPTLEVAFASVLMASDSWYLQRRVIKTGRYDIQPALWWFLSVTVAWQVSTATTWIVYEKVFGLMESVAAQVGSVVLGALSLGLMTGCVMALLAVRARQAAVRVQFPAPSDTRGADQIQHLSIGSIVLWAVVTAIGSALVLAPITHFAGDNLLGLDGVMGISMALSLPGGLVMGLGQWAILYSLRNRSSAWLIGTLGGTLVGSCIAAVGSYLVVMWSSDGGHSNPIAVRMAIGLGVGFAIGMFQLLAMHPQKVTRARWLALLALSSIIWVSGALVNGLVGGTLVGILSVALLWLLVDEWGSRRMGFHRSS